MIDIKKVLIISLCILSLTFITGCTKKEEETKKEEPINIINEDSNSLVLFFSATGTTKTVAQKIGSLINSDIIEIIPKEEYTIEDIDYNNDKCRANKEQNDKNARPEIKNTIEIEKYDTIYIGYPIWWGTTPKIILTLLDNINFENKKIALFCTSGSTGIESSVNDLKKYNSNLNIIGAKRFTLDTITNDDIQGWINETN